MKKILILLVALLTAQMAQAQSASTVKRTTNEIDPAATARIEQSAQAYANLKSFSMFFTVSAQSEGDENRTSSGTIIIGQPNKARLEYTSFQRKQIIISDGKTLFAGSPGAKGFTSPLKPNEGLDTALRPIPSFLSLYLATLLSGKWSGRGPQLAAHKAKLIPDNGVELTLEIGALPNLSIALYFDPADHLLRRVEAKGKNYEGKKFLEITTLTSVQINPALSPDTFKSDLSQSSLPAVQTR